MFFKGVAIAALATLSVAQAPNGTSICDYYTAALTGNNTGANQMTVLTLLVNTAVIGSYSPLANASIKVPGILNPNGTYNGVAVNLVPYFSGEFNSTNDGGAAGVSKNFLDGGGAAPLMNNTPAVDTTSNQYFLLTHLYEFFGLLLGCSEVGMTGFPAYGGDGSMYDVHKFMVLDVAEMGYFITQVALSAASFGVATSDVAKVGVALNAAFNYRCLAPEAIAPSLGPLSQSICTASNCPTASPSNCTDQPTIAAPVGAAVASNTTATGIVASGASGSAAATGTTTAKSSAGRVGSGIAAALLGAVGVWVIVA